MDVAGAVPVKPDDLALGVDANCLGAIGGQGMVEGGVNAFVVQEAVQPNVAEVIAEVDADDLPRGVDALRKGELLGQGRVEEGIGTAAQEEAVDATCVGVSTDDLARIVDPGCKGAVAAGIQGIVEGGVGIDWHDAVPLRLSRLAASVDRETKSQSTRSA